MTTTERATVVGVFANRALAERALDDLHRAGFNDDIGFVVRNITNSEIEPDIVQKETAAGAATGAVGGGVIGGLVGAAGALLIPGIGSGLAGGILVATLGGAALGAVTGGFFGALTGLGIPEEEARYYQSAFETGRTIVTVRAPGRYQEALAILQNNGAYNATTRGSVQEAPLNVNDSTNTDTDIHTGEGYNPNIPGGTSS